MALGNKFEQEARKNFEKIFILLKRLRVPGALSSDDIFNSSDVLNGAGTVSDALDALSSSIVEGTLPSYNPIAIRRIPGFADGTFRYNTASHIQDNLHTYQLDDIWYQAGTFLDNNGASWAIRRALPGQGVSSRMEMYDLSGVTGDPLAHPFEADSHNTCNIGRDSAGHFHIMSNHHNDPPRYVVSINPDDVESGFVEGTLTGNDEDSITYPTFVSLPDGTLLLFYRNGVSGAGNIYLNRYDAVDETWSQLHAPLIDGENGTPGNENPYLNHVVVDNVGTIHLSITWRGTGDADTTNDVSYMKSMDGGNTWQQTDGSVYTIPVTHDTCELAYNTAASGSGLLNQCGMGCDSQGNVYIGVTLEDDDNIVQLYVLHNFMGPWTLQQITSWERGIAFLGSTTDQAHTRPQVIVTNTDRVFVYFWHKFTQRRGSMRCIEATPGLSYFHEFRLMDLDNGESECPFDTMALKLRNELSFIFHPASGSPESWEEDSVWTTQVPLIVTIDLDYIDMFMNGTVNLPRIEVIDSSSLQTTGAAVTTSSTTFASTGPKLALVKETLEQGIPFVKHQVRGSATGTGAIAHFALEEDRDEGTPTTDLIYGDVTIRLADGTITLGTMWMPVQEAENYLWASLDNGGTINGRMRVEDGADTATCNIHTIQLGVLRTNDQQHFPE